MLVCLVAMLVGTASLAERGVSQEKTDAATNHGRPPENPFCPGSPYMVEMERRREVSREEAMRCRVPGPTDVPAFNPNQRDLLELLKRLAWKGLRCRLVVAPAPTPEWQLEILNGKSVILHLPVHRETPLAWHEQVLFWADVQPGVRGYWVTAFDLKTGEKRWRKQIVGLGPVGEKIVKNCAYLEVCDSQLYVIGKEPGGRFVEVLGTETGDLFDLRASRRLVTLDELESPSFPGVASKEWLKKHRKVVLDEEAGIVFSMDRASLAHSLQMHNGNCTLYLTPDTRPGEDTLTLDFLYGERVAYTISVERHFVFRTARDKLFLAVCGTHDAGCSVCAVDVREGRTIWQTTLKGLDHVNLSAYSNHVNMELRPKGLEIIGHESYGDYWERLDPVTGRTIDHRVFRLGWE